MLKIENLYKRFGTHTVLNHCSLSVQRGEVVLLLGENGSGKSTLINCLLRLVRPEEGSIVFEGKDIQSLSQRAYFSKVTAVLESSENIYDYLTGRENLEYFTGLSGQKPAPSDYEELISRFHLKGHMDKKAGTYSRGMRQKLSIIIALLMKPSLLILDEPDLGLDFEAKQELASIINEWTDKYKLTILLASHQTDFIEKLNAKLVLLEQEQLHEIRREDRMYQNQRMKTVFMDGSVRLLTWDEILNLDFCLDTVRSVDRMMNLEDVLKGDGHEPDQD